MNVELKKLIQSEYQQGTYIKKYRDSKWGIGASFSGKLYINDKEIHEPRKLQEIAANFEKNIKTKAIKNNIIKVDCFRSSNVRRILDMGASVDSEIIITEDGMTQLRIPEEFISVKLGMMKIDLVPFIEAYPRMDYFIATDIALYGLRIKKKNGEKK